MTVLINSGDRQVKAGTFDAVENLTQSTATARQTISPHHAITTLSGGTATGFGVDVYTLRGTGTATGAPAVEGVQKTIFMLATGEAKVVIESLATTRISAFGLVASATVFDNAFVTATGAFVFTAPGQFLNCTFMNQKWYVMAGQATFATAS
jgi:hypothetical protein